MAILSGLALVASILLPLDPPDIITCGFLRLTGYPCPFCGMTRAFTAMGHGAWSVAARESPAGAVFYLVTVGVFAFSVTRLIRPAKAHPLPGPGGARVWPWGALIAGTLLLLANWIYRLAMGLK